MTGLHWISDTVRDEGVCEREFAIERAGQTIPGILWQPATQAGRRPLILMGHGGGGHKRNERMLSLDPRYVVAFPGNGVLERLVIEAKARRITVVDRRGPLGTSPKAPAVGRE